MRGSVAGARHVMVFHASTAVTEEDTSKATRFELRLPASLGASIDRWRREQPDIPSRAEAARRLIEIGLEAARADGTGSDLSGPAGAG